MLPQPTLATRAGQIAHYAAIRRRIERRDPPAPRPTLFTSDDPRIEPIALLPPAPQHASHVNAYLAHRRLQRMHPIHRAVLATAWHFGVDADAILGERRTADIVRPRQVAFWVALRTTGRSLPEIGRRFGGKDRTTVLHAVRKIERLRSERSDIATAIESILATLQVQL